jgi:hypothetical protein
VEPFLSVACSKLKHQLIELISTNNCDSHQIPGATLSIRHKAGQIFVFTGDLLQLWNGVLSSGNRSPWCSDASQHLIAICSLNLTLVGLVGTVIEYSIQFIGNILSGSANWPSLK